MKSINVDNDISISMLHRSRRQNNNIVSIEKSNSKIEANIATNTRLYLDRQVGRQMAILAVQKVETQKYILAIPLLKVDGSGRPTEIGSDAHDTNMHDTIAFVRLIMV